MSDELKDSWPGKKTSYIIIDEQDMLISGKRFRYVVHFSLTYNDNPSLLFVYILRLLVSNSQYMVYFCYLATCR